jgi:glycerate dehydrogenase
MAKEVDWKVFNPSGTHRILVTKELPGTEWLGILTVAGYRVEVCTLKETLSGEKLAERIGNNCRAVIGQLTEKWDDGLFKVFSAAGGIIYCNYAVGYDNVDLDSATRNSVSVGNTPGVLTEATAEMAVALTMACSRRITEADRFVRNGGFTGWQPDLFLGKRLWKSNLGIIGAGRIGSAYCMMMVRAFQMNLFYNNSNRNIGFEKEIESFNDHLEIICHSPVTVTYAGTVDEVLKESDVVSIHVPLTKQTRHLITEKKLKLMKPDAVLINTSRGAVIDEAALASFCRSHPEFRAGLDVYEHEPEINKALRDLPNVTFSPHIGSATRWARENMAKLAALNIKGRIEGYPLWDQGAIMPFLQADPPRAIPSIINRSAPGDGKGAVQPIL